MKFAHETYDRPKDGVINTIHHVYLMVLNKILPVNVRTIDPIEDTLKIEKAGVGLSNCYER